MFDVTVTVSKDNQKVKGDSILGLMMLAASPGTEVRLTATGEQAEAVLDAICDLIEAKFEEE